MTPLGIALWFAGVVLVAVGYLRARGPWARYQALKEQDANVARYEAWRGGVRSSGTTGASVAMQVLRRQARDGLILVFIGFGLVLAGFLVSP